MKEENKTAAVLAGVFLLFYALPYFFSALDALSSGSLWEDGNWLLLGNLIPLPLAGLFLILRKPKIAAILMTATVLAALIRSLPVLPEYLKAENGMIAVEEFGNHIVHMPAYLGLTPLLLLLAELLLAATLYTRGPAALILSVLASVSMLAMTALEFQMMFYMTGHPSPLSLIIPLNFVIAAVSAGIYLLSRDS